MVNFFSSAVYEQFNRKQFSFREEFCITLVLLYQKGEGLPSFEVVDNKKCFLQPQ